MDLRKIGIKIWRLPLFRVLLFLAVIPVFAAALNFVMMVVLAPLFNPWKLNYFRIAPWLANTLAVVAAYVVMVRFIDKRNWETTGLVIDGVVRETTIGFVIGTVLMSLVVGVTALFGGYRIVGHNNYSDLVVPFIFLFFASASEEVVCRGYIFQTLERSWGTVVAIVIASFIFGFSHMVGSSDMPLLQRVVGCSCLVVESGLLYSAAYLHRRRLWLPIGMHWAWNYVQGPIFGMPVSGLVYWIPMIKAKIIGSALITGGAWGPEAGMPAFFIRTAAGIFFIVLVYSRGKFLSLRAASASQKIDKAVEETAQAEPLA